jgi:hypothetical protein
MRDRLIELIMKARSPFISRQLAEKEADNLITNGVTFKDVPDTNVGEWISVKDRLPDVDGKYLVARVEGGRYSISVRKFRKEVPCWYTGYCGHWERRTNGITHWMSLPEPPKGE